MRRPILPEKTSPDRMDSLLVSLLILLIGAGLTLLFSASHHRAEILFQDPYHFIRRQFMWVALGVGGAIVLSRMELEVIQRLVPAQLAVSLVLMLLCFVPGLAPEFLGARRWIILFGLSFQPSELVKPVLIIYLSYILSRKQEYLHDAVNTLLPPALVVILFAVLTYLQNDFSTFIFILSLGILMFYIAEVRIRYFLISLLVSVPPTILLLFTREHRVRRIITFLEPLSDPAGAGFQVLASISAITSGGIWGLGIGQGRRKLGDLPEAHSDFIFAVLGEELGFIGVLCVVSLFALFAYKGFALAAAMQDRFRYFLAFGLTASIVLQAFMNIAVASGLLPATGVTLPFFSAGGSSIFVTLLMCGLLLNLSRSANR